MKRAERRNFHIIYKTTCIITNKWYIGMHSTDNIEDGYLGSGSILSRSIKKHGRENHTYEILEYLPDRKSLAKREEELLSKELRENSLCMNIRSGGTGNYPGKPITEETKVKMSISLKETWARRKAEGYQFPKHSEETKKKRALANTGKTRSTETKERMSASQKRYFENLSEADKLALSLKHKSVYTAMPKERKADIAKKISNSKSMIRE